ncbi:MAG: hypothetical protein V3U93_05845 [Alphaproteobacteria bacterium]
MIAETPAEAAHFFGFHDLCPWDPSNERLAVLRADPALRRVPNGDDVAEVCLWEPRSGEITVIGETRAWNWQQGARQQWLPGEAKRLAYNVLDNGSLHGVIADVVTGATTRLPFTVSTVSPNGRAALSPHFARLARHWPAYGYQGADAPSLESPAPSDDGLWRLDLETDGLTLIVSIAEAAVAGTSDAVPEAHHFITHPTYSPTGARICFLHRYFTADGATYTRLIVCQPDGRAPIVLAEEKVSHFDWLDDDTILVWTRALPGRLAAARRSGLLAAKPLRPLLRLVRSLRPGLKQKLFAEAYFLIDINAPDRRTPVGRGLLEQDGHPMYSADRRWILTDTYPDRERVQSLILYDTRADRRIDIGRFHADPDVGDGDIKCDLHPRWDRAERLVCVDSTDRGVRQCLVIDASGVLGG